MLIGYKVYCYSLPVEYNNYLKRSVRVFFCAVKRNKMYKKIVFSESNNAGSFPYNFIGENYLNRRKSSWWLIRPLTFKVL
jgi:hypothetical protein